MTQPSVVVLGVYSPSANASEYEAFLDREVRSQNPINFSEDLKEFLRQVGRQDEIVDLSPEELEDIRADIHRELSTAVLVEVMVEDADERFDMGNFIQPDPGQPEGSWQVGWCEKYLTPDGTELLGEYHFNEVPSDRRFRAVFYIHDWNHENGLNGPYGALVLPPVEPMPSRLWRLAPYEQVD